MASETFELKYKEPFWSTLPPAGCVWALDVIRSGVELPRVPLEGKACFLIGRVPVCDIVLDNETVSRQHAVLQCRGNGKIYVFDLGSTYGTFVNRVQVEPNTYVELHPGAHLRFGSSTRTFVLAGGPPPVADEVAPPAVEETAAEPVAPVPSKASKNKKRRGGLPDDFVGTEEDAEKLIRGEQHRQRLKQRTKARKQQDARKTQPGLDPFMDERDAGDEPEPAEPSEEGSGAESDEGGPSNEGEADPDRVVVGSVKRDWSQLDADDGEADDFYDRSAFQAKRARDDEVLTRDGIENRRAEVDLQRRQLQSQLAELERAARDAALAEADEDELDAYMHLMSRAAKEEQCARVRTQLEALREEDVKLTALFNMASSALDRLAPRLSTASTLQQRAAERHQAFMERRQQRSEAFAEPTAAPVEPVQPMRQPLEPSAQAPAKQRAAGSGTAAMLSHLATVEQKRAPVLPHRGEPAVAAPARPAFVHADPDAADVEVWMPPVGQTGDGSTSLNKKLGY